MYGPVRMGGVGGHSVLMVQFRGVKLRVVGSSPQPARRTGFVSYSH